MPEALDERGRAIHDDRPLPAVVGVDLHLAQVERGGGRRDALDVGRGGLVQVDRPEQCAKLPFLLLQPMINTSIVVNQSGKGRTSPSGVIVVSDAV